MANKEHRQEIRDSLFLLSDMHLGEQRETLRIKVRNLSPGGLMAECPVHAVSGERVTIDLRNIGVVTGWVAWVIENRFGVVFDHEIDPKAVRQPLSSASDVPGMCVRRPLVFEEPLPEIDPRNLRRIC
jgi:hypothetical protein